MACHFEYSHLYPTSKDTTQFVLIQLDRRIELSFSIIILPLNKVTTLNQQCGVA